MLEIGTGWGELALRAARRGAHVTTVTLSVEQAALIAGESRPPGLSSQVDVRVEDYRDVTGTYDAIVSVEMIEAVGERWWPTYFRALDQHLAAGGRIGLQTILKGHHRLQATWLVDLDQHLHLPRRAHPLRGRPSRCCWPPTLLCWSVDHLYLRGYVRHHLAAVARAVQRQRDLVARLGFDPTFQRMWNYYLAYCEAGFRARDIDVAQLILRRPGEG